MFGDRYEFHKAEAAKCFSLAHQELKLFTETHDYSHYVKHSEYWKQYTRHTGIYQGIATRKNNRSYKEIFGVKPH